MKILYSIMILAVLSLFAVSAVCGQDDVRKFPNCKICGMDRTSFVQGRMLIVYADGTTVGVCSLHCAVVEMEQNRNKQITSLMVADYMTKELIDAKTATWVVGGRKQGVMTSMPKWAFAREEDAQKFIAENGGKMATFDQVMKAAAMEGNAHAGHDASHEGPSGQMLFGDDIYHIHPAGTWMVNYRFMHTELSGLRHDTTNVGVNSAGSQPYGYMMIPTKMSMDMQMLMVMYGLTDRLTLMAMTNYQANKMDMLMNMEMGNVTQPPMRTNGFGDTELTGSYGINKYLIGSLSLSIPTGSITEKVDMMGMEFRAPYDMQLGSGTFDLKPSLTYSGLSGDAKWNWGGQATFTYHIDKNSEHYSLGNNLKLTGWLQRALGPFSSWLRLGYNDTGQIKGRDPEIELLLQQMPIPDADPHNYGGQRLDGLMGVSFQKSSFSCGVEGGIPIYQNLNGLQLKTKWLLTGRIQILF